MTPFQAAPAADAPAGALVLHGFTGNPQSMEGVAGHLAAAGLDVELPTLPGHGTRIEDLVPKRWEDWSAAADSSYAAIAARCGRVAVVGLSMGGTLACWLAERHPEIAGLVLVNPLVEPPDEQFRSAVRSLLESGTEIAPGIGSDIADPDAHETTYDGAPLAAALSLFEGTDEVAAGLAGITCPVLLFSSREDHVVAPSSGDLVVSSVRGPVERVWLERSYHVATLDYDRDEIERRTVDFVTALER
ncbi:MAG: alpha/beta fold hydrolase [Actinomycetota bacterium]|nr:alpha/beta fold hydrolase [Actinomycetota bacterium]